MRPGGVTGCGTHRVRLPTQGESYWREPSRPWASSMNRERVKNPHDVQRDTLSKLLSHSVPTPMPIVTPAFQPPGPMPKMR